MWRVDKVKESVPKMLRHNKYVKQECECVHPIKSARPSRCVGYCEDGQVNGQMYSLGSVKTSQTCGPRNRPSARTLVSRI